MELKIYDKQGIVKMTVSPDNSSQWNHEVGVENVVTVNFTTWEFLVLEVGWYILVEGHRFSIKSEYRPKHIHNSKYTYNLKFYGREHDTQDILFCRLNQGEDDLESVFAYDGTPMDFLNKVVTNMNRNSDGVVWKAGEAITANRQTINFNGLYCWDALGEIARTFGTEWWMDGEYLNLSKCVRGESVSLGYGEGLKSGLTQNENTNAVKWFTRLIPVGSSKNIDKSTYGYANLQLPGREKYIDINTQYGLKEYREEAAFSEIYPHRVGTISSVRSEERTNEETGNYTIYYVKDSSLPFNPDEYMIGGAVINMTFNSGVLAGKEFEVNWNNDTSEFEIINQYPDDITQLPGRNLIPSSGDQYVLSNISMPDEYNRAAEEEYQQAVDAFLEEYSKDVSIYSGNTDYIYIQKNNISLLLGLRVNLISEKYFESGIRESRITRISRKLNNLGDASIDCSDAISSSWKSGVESSLNQLEFSIAKEIATSVIQILKSGDSGQPSDYNVLSSLRSINSFLSKRGDDRSKGKIASDKAIEIGNYVSGGSGAIIYKDETTGQTIGEMDKLYIRMKAYFETLEIINVNSVGGKQILSPAGSVKCIGVEETTDEYRCYFLGEQDGEAVENRWKVGDQAYSQMFNAKVGVSNKVSNHYYWRLVAGVNTDLVEYNGQKCHYIDLSKTDCDSGSDVPKVGDIINQRGNRTDIDRMNFIEMSSVDAFSPNITLYHGVNSYSLNGKEYVDFGVDKTTNKAYMNVYGNMYVGDRSQTSYMRYTPENGLEINGTLNVGTKLGDTPLKDLISAASPEGYQEFVEKVTQDIKGLQEQIDGVMESYFYQYAPTLDNYPANSWNTEEKKKAHLKDTFTNLEDGRSWRWTVANSVYGWTEITDTATTQALALAGQAQDTADGKRRVFTSTPYTPYNVGDLWAGGSEVPLKRCIVERLTGSYDASDWDYADNTEKVKAELQTLVSTTKSDLNNAIGQATEAANDYADNGIAAAQQALQGSIDELNQAKANVSDVYSKAEADGVINQAEQDAITAANEAAKAAIELSKITIKAYADGEIDKEEAARIKQAEENLKAAKDYADEKAQEAFNAIAGYEYLKEALGDGSTTVNGGLILTNLIQLQDIDGAIMAGINGTTPKGDKSIANWWGGDMFDIEDYYTWNGREWTPKSGVTIPANLPSGLIRMDGTGYLAKGKFWWDNDGKIYADPTALFLSFNVDDPDVSLSATILDIRDKQAEFADMWEVKTDANGNEYLFAKRNIVTQGGITQYADTTGLNVEGIYDALPIDGSTIYWDNGVLKAKVAEGGITSITSQMVVEALGFTPYDAANPNGYITSAALNGYATQTWVNQQGFLTEHQSLDDYVNEIATSGTGNAVTSITKSGKKLTFTKGATYLTTTVANGLYHPLTTFATVATSGSYNDLSNKPTIPTNTNQLTNGAGFITSSALEWSSIANKPSLLTISNSELAPDSAQSITDLIAKTGGWTLVRGSWSYANNGHIWVDDFGGNINLAGATILTTGTNNWSGYTHLFITSPTSDVSNALTNEMLFYVNNGSNYSPSWTRVLTNRNYSSYALPLSSYTASDVLAKLKTVDGSGSGLDADLLDGTQLNGLFTELNTTKDTNLSITIGGIQKTLKNLNAYSTDFFTSKWNYGSGTEFDLNTWTSGGIVRCYGNSDLLLNKPSGFTYGNVLCLSEGTKALTGQLAWAVNTGSTTDTTKAMWFRVPDSSNGYTYAQWHQIAFTDSNVASATKLQTARTIWGQSFDGTSNIKGNLYVNSDTATTINEDSGKIKFNSINANDTYRSPYIQAINEYSYSRKRLGIFQSNAANYTDDFVEVLSIKPNGNIGINQTSPEYKLDVTGTARITGAVTLGSTLTGNYWHLNNSSTNPYLRLTRSSVNWYVQLVAAGLALGQGSANSCTIDASGNFLSVGGITQYSDIRKKTKLNDVELTLKQVANAPLIEHYYNSDDKKTTHVGSIAQYWAGLNDWFCKLDSDGFYTMEIQNAALASAISVARELERYESKTDKKIRMLKKRINELEDEIEKLKNVA